MAWNVETGEKARSFRWATLRATLAGWRGLAFSPDAKRLAAAYFGNTWQDWDDDEEFSWAAARIFDTETGETLTRLDDICVNSLFYMVTFSPDSKRIAVDSDPNVVIADAETGERIKNIGRPMKPESNPWGAGVSAIAFSHDGRELLTGQESGGIRVWDARPPSEPLSELASTQSSAHVLAFSPDGTRLAAGETGGHITLWDLERGEPLRRLELWGSDIRHLAFSPDGKRLFAVDGGSHMGLWDTESGERLWRLHHVHYQGTRSVSFSPDGKLIASLGTWHLKVRDADTGRLVCQQHDVFRKDHRTIAFSSDSKRVATAGSKSEIHIWDARTGELAQTLASAEGSTGSVAFSPDGKRLATAAARSPVGARIWNLETGLCERVLLQGGGRTVSFSTDGTRVAAWSKYGTLRVSDPEKGTVLHESRASLPSARAVALSPDFSRFAAGEADGIGIRDAKDGRLLARLIAVRDAKGKPGGWLVTTSEGYYKGTTDAARIITWRVGGEVFPVEAFRDAFYRPDLVDKALRGEPLDDVRALSTDDIPPRVTVITPEELDEVRSGQAAISVVARGPRKIEGLEIYANGRRAQAALERGIVLAARGLVMVARDLPAKHRTTQTFGGTVPLPPGEPSVTLRFVAIDEAGLRSPAAEVTVLQRHAKRVQGILHVLAVGVSNYEDPKHNLGLAAKDALAVAEIVKRQAGPGRLYSGVKTTALVDSAATSAGIRAELEDLVAEADLSDTVLLFISGHGLRDDRYNYYFATHEVDLEDLAGTSLHWSEFQGLVRKLRSKQVLVLLDTCHGAGALGKYAATTQALGEMLADRAGVMVLASSSAAEKSYESEEWGHGAFTRAFIDALEGEAGARLTPGVLEDFVAGRVAELTKDRQHPYVPIRTQFRAGTPILIGG